MVMISRIRKVRLWTIATLVAAGSLRCGGDSVPPTTPTTIEMVSGNGQNGVVGQPLPSPLVVLVTDDNGNPVPDVQVTWAAQGGGSVSSAVTQSGSNGQASVTRILGTELGPQGTTATASLDGSPITFTSTAVEPGAPGSIVITTNPPVSALDGEVFDPAVQPVVQVRDGAGIPAPGVQVTATSSSGGTLEGDTQVTTDGNGVAAFGDLGLRGTGTHTLAFTAGSVNVSSSPVEVTPLSSKATTGSWGPVVNWDIVPLHMNLLPSGKIFAWGKRDVSDTMGMPRVWDPASGPPSGLAPIHVTDMLFCAGHTLMPDGTLMLSGGHMMDDRGIPTTYFFSADGAFLRKGPDMHHGRWYPTLTVLPDGRMLTMAGRDQSNLVVTTPEIWENNQWVELPGAGDTIIPYYPRNYVAPTGNGRIFYAGERIRSKWFDVDATGAAGRGAWSEGPLHIYRFNRDYGTSAMWEPGKIFYAGGGGDVKWPTPDPKAATPTATAEIIDINQPSPQWQSAGSMSAPRRHLNSTILPDGTILITGGTRGGGFVDINEADAVKAADLWNPKTGQWTTLAAASRMRVYHSVSLLLPDGTVLHGASGDAMAGPVEVPPERNHEIFSPPYLFKGARPNISSAPGTVSYNQTFSVATPNASQITEVRWIRLGTVTHAFDAGQRANTLNFTRSATGIEVTAPLNPNLAPPGYYQLFVLNRNGVPSQSKFIHIQ